MKRYRLMQQSSAGSWPLYFIQERFLFFWWRNYRKKIGGEWYYPMFTFLDKAYSYMCDLEKSK